MKTKTAVQIADELEQHAKQLLAIADALRGR